MFKSDSIVDVGSEKHVSSGKWEWILVQWIFNPVSTSSNFSFM